MAKTQGSNQNNPKGGFSSQNSGNSAAKQAPSVTTPTQKINFTNDKSTGAKSLGHIAQPVKPLKPTDFIFVKLNYQVMLGGLVVIALGFYLMSGTTDIMSSTKIVIAPIVVLLGFATEFIAIFIKPRKTV